jgi:uncharacterized protein YciI
MFYLLIYDVVENYVERRAAFREEHLKLAKEYAEQGALILGGALSDPVDQAVLVFNADSHAVVEDFVARDPYFQQGLIRSYRIRTWTVVIDNR